jgi:hypothetical protein
MRKKKLFLEEVEFALEKRKLQKLVRTANIRLEKHFNKK